MSDASLLARLVPGVVRRRYAVKFTVSILVVVLVIAGVGVVGYTQAADTVEQSTEDQLTETSSLRGDSLGNWVESMKIQTRSVSAGTELRQGAGARAYLRSERRRLSSDILSMHYVNASTGTIEASTVTPLEGRGLDEVEAPWTEADVASGSAGASDQVWVSSRSYESPVHDSEPVVAFASAVPAHDDRYVVVVSRIQTHLDTIVEGESDGTTQIVNADGEAVLRPDTGIDASVHESGLASVRSDGDAVFDESGGQVHAYAAVPGTDWVAITTVEKSTAFAVRDTVATNVGGIVVASLLSLTLVGVVLARQTVTPLADLRDKAGRMEDGDLDVDFETARVDEIGRLYGAFGSMRDSLRQQIRNANEARERAELARAEAEELNQHLERKADRYSEVMQAAGSGDLTVRMDPESKSEAMTDIAEEFNEMVAELEATTDRVKAFAGDVAAASEQVTASSEEVRSASEQVTESVQQISDGAERQNQSLRSVDDEMDQLATTTEEIAASSNEVADLAERTARTGREGRDAAQAAIEGMDAVESEAEDAVDAIAQLEAEMAQIDELIEFITDLANETNMLALNANIEASRGGTDGDGDGQGFAVVAQQVKELAQDTKEAAEDIEGRLEGIKAQTDATAEEVEGTADRIAEQASSVERAADALDEIAEYAQETNTGVQEISAATEQQAASTEEVVAMVDDAATISEETTSEAENVAAAAEEQTTALTEVSDSASDLSDQAAQLSEVLGRFETDPDEETDSDLVEAPASATDSSFEFGN
ncbi:methyl-accepting chemotaxis protein [Haloarchaeobius iranensis]|uniref:Methyl-accepting chemotaxis protein n=1 Tax=Haloarchaeobius iranensis TaxID=996166 RepID=A0A1G9VFW8_9EURY|nr:methyl-accepting chemotaxis protein [Haloarchaeobius iranensis]SDM71006.1 methyl-accepting chemotaxis protein [Haloarchaeobius iranensis]